MEVGKHGKDANAPCIFHGLVRTAPAEEVVLVGVHLDIEKRSAGSVGTEKFLVEACPEKLCRVDDVFQFLLVKNGTDSRIYRLLIHGAKCKKRFSLE